jgi:hypothetical protein
LCYAVAHRLTVVGEAVARLDIVWGCETSWYTLVFQTATDQVPGVRSSIAAIAVRRIAGIGDAASSTASHTWGCFNPRAPRTFWKQWTKYCPPPGERFPVNKNHQQANRIYRRANSPLVMIGS